MSRLTVVSNRLPVALQRDAQSRWTAARSPGGLVSALDPVLRRKGGRWIGWAGVAAEECDEATASAVLAELAGDFDLEPVPLARRDVELYYHGFSNSVVWPLFHGLVDRCRFDARTFTAYGEANQRFARRLASGMDDGEVAWVHDYQLMQVGPMVRRERPGACLGFFLHIPFPAPDELRRLPWWREVMDALLSYDLVGLQTARDLRAFGACVAELVGVEPEREGALLRVPLGSRTVTAAAFPIGIDAAGWSQLAGSPEVERRMSDLRRQIGPQAVLLGVDRLDYTKGLIERVAAYERLLEEHPELRGQVVLVQVVVPSREAVPDYAALRAELDRRIGRVSGRLGTPGWTPIRYVYGGVPAPELAALYRMADVALVTPVCDGMNLVAKEYCAAQVDEVGALVLGERAGAAEQLGPAGAVLVPPGEVGRTAAAIHQALTMDVRGRRARMAAMRRVVADATVFRWADDFLAELERTRAARQARRHEPLRAGARRAATAIGTPPAGVRAHQPAAPGPRAGRASAAT
ncbi:MAG TPA: trehalose-6-phosphate synthase [Kofleriaceae bacterium]|nr:trehalose-6-phosphate synthase [Kofleriaceae bacterium]